VLRSTLSHPCKFKKSRGPIQANQNTATTFFHFSACCPNEIIRDSCGEIRRRFKDMTLGKCDCFFLPLPLLFLARRGNNKNSVTSKRGLGSNKIKATGPGIVSSRRGTLQEPCSKKKKKALERPVRRSHDQ
jgi:hypothetical protein